MVTSQVSQSRALKYVSEILLGRWSSNGRSLFGNTGEGELNSCSGTLAHKALQVSRDLFWRWS